MTLLRSYVIKQHSEAWYSLITDLSPDPAVILLQYVTISVNSEATRTTYDFLIIMSFSPLSFFMIFLTDSIEFFFLVALVVIDHSLARILPYRDD